MNYETLSISIGHRKTLKEQFCFAAAAPIRCFCGYFSANSPAAHSPFTETILAGFACFTSLPIVPYWKLDYFCVPYFIVTQAAILSKVNEPEVRGGRMSMIQLVRRCAICYYEVVSLPKMIHRRRFISASKSTFNLNESR